VKQDPSLDSIGETVHPNEHSLFNKRRSIELDRSTCFL
jgi:hypothetical protein